MKSMTLAHLTIGATPEENIDAAAAAGFGAVGLRICGRRPSDAFAPAVLGDEKAARSLQRRAKEQGIRLSNLSAYQFYPDVGWHHLAPVIEAAQELQAPVLVVNSFQPDEAAFVQLFARYCEAAQPAGLRVALEFLPYSAVKDLAAANRVLDQAGAPNAGLLLDALHLERSGGSPADLRAIDPGRVVFAQLCDARRWTGPRSDEALMQEARSARLPAGTGELPLHEFLDALPAGVELEYEVARADLAGATPLAKAQAASADARRFMAAHAARPKRPAGVH